ncbi:hypothetical protein N2152v2_005184 [Parachlorella kessleri]
MGGKGGSQPATWPPSDLRPEHKLATFAGGCFWSVELAFQRVPGVVKTAVGYSGGHKANPSYEEVCRGTTGHTEAVQMVFDPKEVSYDRLVKVFFDKIDPLQKGGQGNDIGSQYRTAVFYHDQDQKQVAEAHKAAIPVCAVPALPVAEAHKAAIPGCVVDIDPYSTFWPAEEYHQQ